MQISIIAALANNRVIGYQNQLPWHLPADLRHFKELTLGKPIIMGRKTFESIGKPLPGRKNIVVTRDQGYQADGCVVAHSLPEALAQAGAASEVMIIGGTELFAQALPLAHCLYLTFIRADFTGDVFFPLWDAAEWEETERQDFGADEKNKYSYSFINYSRRQSQQELLS